jgi:hypothetical protein
VYAHLTEDAQLDAAAAAFGGFLGAETVGDTVGGAGLEPENRFA